MNPSYQEYKIEKEDNADGEEVDERRQGQRQVDESWYNCTVLRVSNGWLFEGTGKDEGTGKERRQLPNKYYFI